MRCFTHRYCTCLRKEICSVSRVNCSTVISSPVPGQLISFETQIFWFVLKELQNRVNHTKKKKTFLEEAILDAAYGSVIFCCHESKIMRPGKLAILSSYNRLTSRVSTVIFSKYSMTLYGTHCGFTFLSKIQSILIIQSPFVCFLQLSQGVQMEQEKLTPMR